MEIKIELNNALSVRALFADDPPTVVVYILHGELQIQYWKFNNKLKEQDDKIEATQFDVNNAIEHIRKV